MVHLNKFFIFVAGLHSLVSYNMSAKATNTALHINNFTSFVYGEQVTLLCGSNSTANKMISAITLSKEIKTNIEPIVQWSNGAWTQIIPKGRNWTVTIDNNTGDIQLNIQDLSNVDYGIYFCNKYYDEYSQKNWLNLTRSDQFESESKTDNYDILQSVASKFGLSFGVVGVVAIFTGLLVAFWKRRFWLQKLDSGRNLKSSQEELQNIDNIPFVHRVISEIIDIVDLNGVNTEGIYRLSSSQCELAKARQDIEQDINAVKNLPVIILSNVLKALIRELAPPLINEAVLQELLRENACTTESEKCTMMKSALELLDIARFECLYDIILHLRRVAENAAINKMTVENLAVVFAPSLLPTALSYDHLKHSDAIQSAIEENNLKTQEGCSPNRRSNKTNSQNKASRHICSLVSPLIIR